MSEDLKPKNFHFKETTRAAMMNKPFYVFTPLRDLEVRDMGLCFRELHRCELQLVETYPKYTPSYQALLESGQLIIEEKMIPASSQVLTLQEAFGREGLRAIDCDYSDAVRINTYLNKVKGLTLMEAIEWFNTNVEDKEIKDILAESFREAFIHATAVINVTRREVQNARSGKSGKAFIDDRDSLFAQLIGVTELSILAPEGAAANNNVANLVSQLSNVFGNAGGFAGNNIDMEKILQVVANQNQKIEELQAMVASKK
jgi:hypothetical protein